MVSQGYFIPLGYQELKNAQESPKWSTTDGIIISSGIKESKDEDSTTYEANVRYEYTIGEKRYSSNQVSFGQYGSSDPEHTQSIVRRYKKGQKVNVYVNPAHPDKSVLEPGATWSSYLPLGTSAIFVGIGAIIAIFSGIVAPRLRRRRTEALRQAASTLGLTFLDEAIMLENEAFYEFPLFRRGYSRETSNILCKDNATGKTLFLFDYEFYEGGGKNSRQHHQTVAAFYLPNRNLPEFSLRPENVFDKIGEFFGGQDIDFKSYPEFSESYRLQGCLESAIRKAFNFKVLQFFSQNPDWWLEGGGEWLVIYQLNRQVESKELDFFLCQITKISRLFSQ
jgi:hypothetical protein